MNGELVVVYLHSTVLGGAIHTSWFEGVVEVPQKHILECRAPSQFAALIRPNASTVFVTMLSEKFFDDVDGGGF